MGKLGRLVLYIVIVLYHIQTFTVTLFALKHKETRKEILTGEGFEYIQKRATAGYRPGYYITNLEMFLRNHPEATLLALLDIVVRCQPENKLLVIAHKKENELFEFKAIDTKEIQGALDIIHPYREKKKDLWNFFARQARSLTTYDVWCDD